MIQSPTPLVSRLACFVLLLLVWLCGPRYVQAQVLDAEKAFPYLLKSTAWILAPHIENGVITGAVTGTAGMIDMDKRILVTNWHVVGEMDEVLVVFPQYDAKKQLIPERDKYRAILNNPRNMNKSYFVAKVLTRDKKKDLALLQIPKMPPGIAALPLAKEAPPPGRAVFSLGNPGASGALWVLTKGEVRQVYNKKWRVRISETEIAEMEARIVETSSPTNQGDSGGPLISDRGEMIGVTQGGAVDAAQISTFVEISEVRKLLVKIGVTNPKPGQPPIAGAGDATAANTDDAASSTNSAADAEKAKAQAEQNAEADALKAGLELRTARGAAQEAALKKLRESKGLIYTRVLADTINQMSAGPVRDRAREALTDRLSRMTKNTLSGYLQHEDRELRRAAAAAVARKELNELASELVPLLKENDSLVSDEAYETLKRLSGRDFGKDTRKWMQWAITQK